MSDFSKRLLPVIKVTLRETSTEFDEEILGYIDTCAADLKDAGILNFFFEAARYDWEVDPQILQAVRWYCLSVFGLYNADMEKYQTAYRSLKSTLATQSKYTKDPAESSSSAFEEIVAKLYAEINALSERVIWLEEEEKGEHDIGRHGQGDGAEVFNDYADNLATGLYSSARNKDTQAHGGGSDASGGGTTAGVPYSVFLILFGLSDNDASKALYEAAKIRSAISINVDFPEEAGYLYWFAHAEGEVTYAYGRASHTEGFGTYAENDFAHAEGSRNKSRGISSHTEGNSNEANASNSHAEGENNKSNGLCSHTEGYGNTADAPNSHVEGRGNTIGEKAEGAHIEGGWNSAAGSYSHVEGQSNKASASFSHVEGLSNEALHSRAHIEGQNNRSSAVNQHISGKYNADNSNALVIVGNGTSEKRSNAFELLMNGDGLFAGRVSCQNPTVPENAATKKYVDDLVGNVESALDAVIAIQQAIIAAQNNLIGGGS